MKLLIIGSNGYIGSALSVYLAEHHDVTCVDKFGLGLTKDVLRDYDDLDAEFFESFDVVIYMAGLSSVSACQASGVENTINSNVVKFVRLVNKLKDHRFIYASTGAVYGCCGPEMASETDRTRTTALYDWSKKLVDDYMFMSKIDYYALRLGSVFGLSPNMRTDLVLNKCIFDISKGSPAMVYGSNVWRAFLDIKDLCRAIHRILSFPPRPGVYNMCGLNMHIKDICAKLLTMYPDTTFGRRIDLPLYDFSMNNNKFKSVYDFEFTTKLEPSLEEMYYGFKNSTVNLPE